MPQLRGEGSKGWSREGFCSPPLVLPGSLQEGQTHGKQAEERAQQGRDLASSKWQSRKNGQQGSDMMSGRQGSKEVTLRAAKGRQQDWAEM